MARTVIYYKHPEALDGFYPDMKDQYKTDEGLFIGLAYRIQNKDNLPMQVTYALIEDPQTHKIIHVDPQLFTEFKD
jgi:hypothetical protein